MNHSSLNANRSGFETRPYNWLKASIAGCLVVLLSACGGEIVSRQAVTVRVAVTSSMEPLMRDALTAYQQVAPEVKFELVRGNADTMTQAIVSGDVEWGLTPTLTADSTLWSAAVGSDRLAIVVNRANPVEGLTSATLRQLYQGQMAEWESPDGFESALTLVSREPGSAARGAFDELVMGGLPIASTAVLATSAENVPVRVASDTGAIGYVSAALVSDEVRIVPLDGLLPGDPSYPLVTTIRLVALDEPTGAAREFLTWLLSDEGQQTVGLHYTPLAR